MSRMRRVALIYDAKLPYDVKVMRGVASYLQQRGGWNVFIEERALHEQRLPDLQAWRGEGIIADLDDPRVAAIVHGVGLPAVGFGGGYGWRTKAPGVPYVFTNNAAVARLAAEHLLDRGFRHFAFCGYPKTDINGWAAERESTFTSIVAKRALSCSVYRGRHRAANNRGAFHRWLRSLPAPVGLMAANDKRARQVLEGCRLAGLHVPRDVAVIGVDNDEMICELSHPTLSSVEQGCAEIGYRAAALLDSMMAGAKPGSLTVMVEPRGVVTRQSTDVMAVKDPRVGAALELANSHAHEGWKVDDVVRALGVSRSTLEFHFRAALGRSVADEMRRVRLEKARRLAAETEMPLKAIAAGTGFRSIQHMTSCFHRYLGQTPAQYRRSHGSAGLMRPRHGGLGSSLGA